MSNAINVETNPTRATSIEKEQTINRLEKIKEKCDKISKIMEKAYIGSAIVGGVGIASSCLFPGILYTSIATEMAVTVLASSAVFVASSAGLVAHKLISTQVESKLKNLQKQINPKSYFQKIFEKEQKKLKISEDAASGNINIKTLHDAGIDIHSINSIESFTKEASKKLPERKQTVAILEVAQEFIKKCNNKESILELLDLAENPLENKEAIQKIVLPHQTPVKASIHEVAKSATQRSGE